MREALRKLFMENVEGQVADEVVKIAQQSVAQGKDTNSMLKAIVRKILDEAGPVMKEIGRVPGLTRLTVSALPIGIAHIVERSDFIDKRLAGKEYAAARLAIKHALPAVLIGVGKGGADVMEKLVDGEISPADHIDESERTARMDDVVLLDDSRYGLAHFLIPLRDQKTGRILLTPAGNPQVEDAFAMKVITDYERAHKDDPKALCRVVSLDEYIKALKSTDSIDGLDEARLQRLEALLEKTPKEKEDLWSADVLAVQSALKFSSPLMDPLMRAELEKLWRSAQNAHVRLVNHHIGEFAALIGVDAPPGQLSMENVQALIDGKDLFLDADQGPVLHAMKFLKRTFAYAGGVELSWHHYATALISMLGLSVPALMWMFVTMMALSGLVTGIVLCGSPMGTETFATALVSSMGGGLLGWFITWGCPPVQKALKGFVAPGEDADWLNDIGRQVAAFAMVLGTGILPTLIFFEVPNVHTALFVSVSVISQIGVMYGYSRMSEHQRAKSRALKGLSAYNWLFGISSVAVLVAAAIANALTPGGAWLTGPQFIQGVVSLIAGAAVFTGAALVLYTAAKLIAIAGGWVGAHVLIAKFERVKDDSGRIRKDRLPLAHWAAHIVAMLLIIGTVAAPMGAWYNDSFVGQTFRTARLWMAEAEPDAPAAAVSTASASTTPIPVSPVPTAAGPTGAKHHKIDCSKVPAMYRTGSCK